MKLFKVPANPSRLLHAVGVRAARAAASTHVGAVKPGTSGAMQRLFTAQTQKG
jgi:hypothetical protein